VISNIAARLARVMRKNNHRRILGRGRWPWYWRGRPS